jgi:hypothetical protein
VGVSPCLYATNIPFLISLSDDFSACCCVDQCRSSCTCFLLELFSIGASSCNQLTYIKIFKIKHSNIKHSNNHPTFSEPISESISEQSLNQSMNPCSHPLSYVYPNLLIHLCPYCPRLCYSTVHNVDPSVIVLS